MNEVAVNGKMKAHYHVECIGPDGKSKWVEEMDNIIPNVGLDEILDKVWKGSGYTAAHYVGLTDGTPTVAAGDTMSSHAGWSEVVAYSESVRQTLTLGTVSSQSVDNSDWALCPVRVWTTLPPRRHSALTPILQLLVVPLSLPVAQRVAPQES